MGFLWHKSVILDFLAFLFGVNPIPSHTPLGQPSEIPRNPFPKGPNNPPAAASSNATALLEDMTGSVAKSSGRPVMDGSISCLGGTQHSMDK